ncbi:type II secretion system GspH family protein [Acidobacteria bacterium AH-259-L09]|nr:type II secretion system GspH family protein [Acidobacteria bacterium AH-259-L09]
MRNSVASASKNSGFSLIELLLVVAVIGIVAAMAVPRLSQSKMAANETAAITYLRTWVNAQELYYAKYMVYADADNQLFNEGLISVKGAADSHGYTYSLDNPSGSKYTWWGKGWPDTPGSTGKRYFFIDQSGVIRYSTTGQANSSSPPLGSQ